MNRPSKIKRRSPKPGDRKLHCKHKHHKNMRHCHSGNYGHSSSSGGGGGYIVVVIGFIMFMLLVS